MSRLEMDTDELREALESDAAVRVLDIRDRDDHREWRVPGSRHLPWRSDPAAGPAKGVDCADLAGDGPAVVVCASGRTSLEAARWMRERCGIDARSLRGGMAGWSFAWNAAEVEGPGGPAAAVQLRRTGKGCLSYLVGSEGEALAVDPSLDPEIFRDQAAARGWTITGVVETHLHADHVSRGRRLADAEGVPLLLPDGSGAEFPHRTLGGGDSVPVGATRLDALHTPGHTSASLSYRVDDQFLLTGDTLFLDGVGRPDLEARGDRERVRRHARMLHRSVSRLLAMDAGLTVLPAHTSDPVPFDGDPVAAPLGEVRGRVRITGQGEDGFARALADGIPATPPNYERIVALNEEGAFPAEDLLELEAGANRCAAD